MRSAYTISGTVTRVEAGATAVPIIIIVVPIGSGRFAGFGVVRPTFTTSACRSVSPGGVSGGAPGSEIGVQSSNSNETRTFV